MRGIIFDIKRFAIHDGPGIRTTFFLKGCPLQCKWCHNPESNSFGIQELDFEFKGKTSIGWEMTAADVLREAEKDQPFFEESGGGITFSGGEPLSQPEFLVESAKLLKTNDFHVTIDTTGYSSTAVFTELLPWTDLFLFDLKHMNEQKHFEYTGVSNKRILQNLEFLVSRGKEIFIRYPMIPGINDSVENLDQMTGYLKEINHIKRIHLLPYHKIAAGKYEKLQMNNDMMGVEEPNPARVNQVKDRIEKSGFEVVIG